MAILSLKSRHSRIFIFVLILIAVILALQTGISYLFTKLKPKALGYLNSTFGYRFDIGDSSFTFLRGLHIKSITINAKDKDNPLIVAKDIFLSLKILPLFIKRTLAIHVAVDEASLSLNKQRGGMNLQIIFSDIYKRSSEVKVALPKIFKNAFRISVRQTKVTYYGNNNLEKTLTFWLKNSEINQESESFNFEGTIDLNYRIPENSYLSGFLKNNELRQLIKYSVQGNIKGEDTFINLISLKIGEDQILGTGFNKGFAERNPYLNINFIPSTLSLESIGFIKEGLGANGYAVLSANLYGPMDNTKIDISGKLEYCNLKLAFPGKGSYEIRDLCGEIGYRDNRLQLNEASLKLNSIPLNIKLNANIFGTPGISLHLFLPEDFLASEGIPFKKLGLILSGEIKNNFTGDIRFDASYVKGNEAFDMAAHLKNIDFDYSNPIEKQLNARKVELIKSSTPEPQKLNFADLKSKIYTHKGGIEVKQVSLSGYGALLNGQINLDTSDKVSLNFVLDGKRLTAEKLMQDINIRNGLLSGDMDVKIDFDNQRKDSLKGSCHIKNGVVDLGLLAKIVKLPSLKNINFNVLEILFTATKDRINVEKVKLISKSVLLDAFWNMDSNVEGSLNLKIASKLLNQSPTFRKLISLTKIKKPYIDFRFALGGIPKAARVMWLKGEFKDKITEELPLWVKKRIEKNLDKMLEELSGK